MERVDEAQVLQPAVDGATEGADEEEADARGQGSVPRFFDRLFGALDKRVLLWLLALVQDGAGEASLQALDHRCLALDDAVEDCSDDTADEGDGDEGVEGGEYFRDVAGDGEVSVANCGEACDREVEGVEECPVL